VNCGLARQNGLLYSPHALEPRVMEEGLEEVREVDIPYAPSGFDRSRISILRAPMPVKYAVKIPKRWIISRLFGNRIQLMTLKNMFRPRTKTFSTSSADTMLVVVDVPDQPKGSAETEGFGIVKPNVDFGGEGVDAAHEGDLVGALFEVRLVDADGVDPDGDGNSRIAKAADGALDGGGNG